MTFDEAIEKLEQLANFEVGKTTGNIRRDFKLELGDVRDLLTELREEYAPTVEMTKQEFEIFSKAKVDEDSAEWLDNVAWDRVDYKYPDFFMAWLHPETVQIIDDDQS
ncbi:hypothetical protein ACGYLR_07020 [Leuconostoc lactis]|uniref:hypothetical protein n=1 Tax=Leuconostoc lactis TaxID=1246 RepID=UPI0037461414